MDEENSYWTDIGSEEEARKKIITHPDFDKDTEKEVKFIVSKLVITKTDCVADFGCGIGRLMKPISQHCHTILGFDISKPMLHGASKYCDGLKNILLKPLINDNTIFFGNENVDKIYSLMVLQHIEKSKTYNLLCEFNRILKVGGTVFIQFPHLDKCKSAYFEALESNLQLGSLSARMEFFTRTELEFLFSFANLDILEIEEKGTDFYVLAEKRQPYNIQRKVIAKVPYLV